MPKLTAAEIALQEKFAELRRKKEQNKLKSQQPSSTTAKAGNATTAGPASAVDKAKALLAQKQAAAERERKSHAAAAAAAPSQEKLDPKEAAKRALEAKKNKAAATKRPSLKRPASRPAQKPAPRDAQPGQRAEPHGRQTQDQGRSHPAYGQERGAVPSHGSDADYRSSKRHKSAAEIHPTPEHIQGEATLFVGDLPPYHSQEDLYHTFSHFGPVEDIRLVRSQCYAFVRFDSKATAEATLASCTAKPLVIAGHELRVNQSYGTLPEWKRSMPGGGVSSTSQHPKVLEARKQGDLIADALEASEMLQSHGMDFYSRPQEREIVAYDDL